MVPVEFQGFSASQIDRIADYLSGLAWSLRAVASQKRRPVTLPWLGPTPSEIAASGQAAAQLIDGGLAVDKAISQICRRLDVPPLTVAAQLRRYRRQQRQAAQIGRQVDVMRLAARGWTNAAIGRQLRIHPKSVSRILQRQLKGQPGPPQSGRVAAAAGAAGTVTCGRISAISDRRVSAEGVAPAAPGAPVAPVSPVRP